MSTSEPKGLESYSSKRVAEWVAALGLANQSGIFVEHDIDGSKLVHLSKEGLQELGLKPLQAKKILRSIQAQTSKQEKDVASESTAAAVVERDPGSVSNSNSQPLYASNATVTKATSQQQHYSHQQHQRPYQTNPCESVVYRMSDAFGYETRIEGFETQQVSIDLGPTHAIQSEPGSLIYMTEGVDFITKTDGKGWQRFITGQRIFLTEWSYPNGAPGTKGTVAFAANFPGRIVPINLQQHGGRILCQRGSFLCCSKNVDTKIAFVQKLGAGFFGGTGFILQEFAGNGHVFLNAGGVVTKLNLAEGQSLRVTTGSLVAFDQTVTYQVETVGTFFDAFFGREGLFFTSLSGPGTVWLQSLPPDQFVAAVYSRIPKCPSQREEDAKSNMGAVKVAVGAAALFQGVMDDNKHLNF